MLFEAHVHFVFGLIQFFNIIAQVRGIIMGEEPNALKFSTNQCPLNCLKLIGSAITQFFPTYQ